MLKGYSYFDIEDFIKGKSDYLVAVKARVSKDNADIILYDAKDDCYCLLKIRGLEILSEEPIITKDTEPEDIKDIYCKVIKG